MLPRRPLQLLRPTTILPQLSRTPPSRSLSLIPFRPKTPPSNTRRAISLFLSTGLIFSLPFLFSYVSDSRAGIHKWVLQPALVWCTKDDPEKAHRWAIKLLSMGFVPKDRSLEDEEKRKQDEEVLGFKLWGRRFSSPIGLAAGFDKHGEAIDALFDLGFSYVEVGSVTPEAQPGNPQPRVFHLGSTESLINRYGFPSHGHDTLIARLQRRINDFVRQHRFEIPDDLIAQAIGPDDDWLIVGTDRDEGLEPVSSPLPSIATLTGGGLEGELVMANASSTLPIPPYALTPSSSPPSSLTSQQPHYASELLDPISRLLYSDSGSQSKIPDIMNYSRSLHEDGKLLSINLGKNKTSSEDSIEDFLKGIKKLGPFADILVINISSPNTKGLRNLQRVGMIENLLKDLKKERDRLNDKFRPPLLIKISPDLLEDQLVDLARAVIDIGVDGIIVSNTTVSRQPEWGDPLLLSETGGFSGPPLKPLSLQTLSTLYRLTSGKIPLIGCGGITSAQDAIDYAQAGASFVQAYTAFGYKGVGWVSEIREDLIKILKRDGNKKWSDLIGSGMDPDSFGLPEKKKLEPTTTTTSREVWMEELTKAKQDLGDLIKLLDEYDVPREPLPLPLEVPTENESGGLGSSVSKAVTEFQERKPVWGGGVLEKGHEEVIPPIIEKGHREESWMTAILRSSNKSKTGSEEMTKDEKVQVADSHKISSPPSSSSLSKVGTTKSSDRRLV